MKYTLIAMALLYTFIQPNSSFGQEVNHIVEKYQKEARLILTEFDLDEKQAFEVQDVMLKSIEKVKEIVKEIGDNENVLKYYISSIEDEKDKDLEACLSEEQWIIFNILRKQMMEQRPKKSKASTKSQFNS